jgi:nucleotide-binding universal stress UspA family protein
MSGIVVGFDGSRGSQRALEWAVREAALRQVPLTVLNVYNSAVTYWGGAVDVPQDGTAAERARDEAQEATEKALALAGDQRPAHVTVETVAGLAAEELLSAGQDADMVVVGARGTGGFARLLLGSVSGQVAHHAHCPVVIIPGEERQERPQ